jgi:hypothetical protein
LVRSCSKGKWAACIFFIPIDKENGRVKTS